MSLPWFQPRFLGFLLLLLLSASLTVVAGCQGDGRLAIEGTVTVNGKPLDKGYLRIFGDRGPSAGSPVENGNFRIDADRGVMVGTYRVEITSTKPTGRKVREMGSDKMVDELAQFIPARYNTATELKIEVTQSGPNHFDLELALP